VRWAKVGALVLGGTVLGSARCEEFKTEEGRRKALEHLQRREISGVIIIGGDGSQTGAYEMSRLDFPVIGIASTIDNDLNGSDITIGVDTALNIALEAIDRLKVTASSHQRAFLVEVMGRDSGYLALMSGIAGGAEAIVLPEIDQEAESIAAQIVSAYDRGKSHAIVVVAEGARYNADLLASHFHTHRDRLGFELRVTKLGHIQRGGTPRVYDRIIASQLGAAAAEHAVAGEFGITLGIVNGKVTSTPLAALTGSLKPLDRRLFELAHMLTQ